MKLLLIVVLLMAMSSGLRVDLTETNNQERKVEELKAKLLDENNIRMFNPRELGLMQEGKLTFEDERELKSDNPIVDLLNLKNIQYFGPATVGNKGQVFSVVYDTGSSWFWVPKFNWVGCPGTGNRFDPATSSTYVNTGARRELSYAQGDVQGYVSFDNIGLKGYAPGLMTFIPVDIANNLDSLQADGIVGLAPTSSEGADLLVDTLFDTGLINVREFTVFFGKKGVDNSHIEFGKNQDDLSGITYLPLTPVTEGAPLNYWSTDFDDFKYGDVSFQLNTNSTVWDTGTSLIVMTSRNLQKLALFMADDKPLGRALGYYLIRCNKIEDFEDLKFTFKDKTIVVSKYEYVVYNNGYWLIYIDENKSTDPRMQFTILGATFLRGSKVIHDMDRQRLGLFPQIIYDYTPTGTGDLTWLWILLSCIGALIIILSAFCMWRYRARKAKEAEPEVGYQRVGGTIS